MTSATMATRRQQPTTLAGGGCGCGVTAAAGSNEPIDAVESKKDRKEAELEVPRDDGGTSHFPLKDAQLGRVRLL